MRNRLHPEKPNRHGHGRFQCQRRKRPTRGVARGSWPLWTRQGKRYGHAIATVLCNKRPCYQQYLLPISQEKTCNMDIPQLQKYESIDFILIQNESRHMVKNSRAYDSAEIGSDHFPVLGHICQSPPYIRRAINSIRQLQSHLAPFFSRKGIQQNPAQSDEAEDGEGNS